MDSRSGSVLFVCISAAITAIYFFAMPAAYPRIGLYAGLGVGVIFGSTVPVEDLMRDRLHRAIRSSIAFAVTTGIGYGFYQGQEVGISWGAGGLVGCSCGALTGQLARGLLVKEDPA